MQPSPPPPASPSHSPAAAQKPRVLLVNLNTYTQPYPVYPLGLAYIDGALREAGYETALWDSRAHGGNVAEFAARFQPEFVGISLRNIDNAQSHNPLSFVRDLANCCDALRKVTRAPLIAGGSAISLFPRELLELTGADYGVQGEGEASFVALLATLRGNDPRAAQRIPGIVWHETCAEGQLPIQNRDAGRSDILASKIENPIVHCNPCAAKPPGFTAEPAHDPDVLKAYVSGGALIGVQTQRGCPLKCCYCAYPKIEGRRSRFRSGAEVAEEMARLRSLGVRYTFIVDSVFNTREEHVADVCEALIKANLGMEWECFLRPRGITRDQLALMQRAGMRHIEFGSDSFSDPVLEAYGKSFTYADILQASRDAGALGLKYGHFLIFGGPGETPESVEETLRRAAEIPDAYYFATIGMRIYPGTPLWEKSGPPATGEPVESYLATPRFHIEPPLTVQSLCDRLMLFRKSAHNWVVGDPPPAFIVTMEKLRRRGIHGPLWEYIEVLQRYGQSA